ncbi:DUF3153 domain-containing protein [Nodosilinea sp. P-1105]|uniref:DUF3153 domain-containing protein n=1 Tax=Nodosilinea sp. P-1105 TaxID=2546229 RepID=UPI00146A0AAA|nr:DUF3153 domain-containing protein [Nodosilinea sp. P-1105]NMF85126.1 DUF3153 domain-containing protein [Nodosilinea sp. P-1105]
MPHPPLTPLFRLAVLLSVLLLSGCVQYDLTLSFDHQHHGQIRQVIDLNQRGAALANPTWQPWLEDLRDRIRPLGGQLQRAPQTIALTVPFSTPADLVNRYSQLLGDRPAPPDHAVADQPALTLPGLGSLPLALTIQQTDWLLASRIHLTYDLDLRSLPANGDGDRQIAPWADLRFRLQVPWGIREVLPGSVAPQTLDRQGATWMVQPGQQNHIEVTFWLPNTVALGGLGIAVLVLLGYSLRYGRRFRPMPPKPPSP